MILTDPSTLCLILLVVIAAFLLVRTRRRLAHQREPWDTAAMQARDYGEVRQPGSSAEGGLPDEAARWEVEMHETARRLSAQLDAKLSLLQTLIADAQRAAARLEEALNRARPALPPGSQAESLRPVAGHGRDLREFDRIENEPDRSAREDVAEDGDSGDGESGDNDRRAGDRGQRRAEICRLADYGFAATEIAHRVGTPVGEVELILSLHNS
jgi:hypothetical protein